MAPKRQKLISWSVCLLVPVLMMIYALIAHPDGLYAAPGQYVINVLTAILVPVLYVLPYLLWIASAIAVGVIIYKAKQILVPGSTWKAAACGVFSGIISCIFLYDVVTLSHENGIRTMIASSILFLFPLGVYPLSAWLVHGKGETPKTTPIFAKTLLGLLVLSLFLVLWFTRDAQAMFDKRKALEAAYASVTLNEGDDQERATQVDKGLKALIRQDTARAPSRMWLMTEAILAQNVSPFEDELWITVPPIGEYENFLFHCRRDHNANIFVSWGDESMSEETVAIMKRVCVKRAAEF